MIARSVRHAAVRTLLVVALAAVGCGDATGPDFDESLGVDLSLMTLTASGLYVLDLTVGSGETAISGARATVDYSGWLTSGRRFDFGTYAFRLGRAEAIAGFDEGVQGMRVGGKRRLVIPPSLGYGDNGSGPIPPKAYLLFEIELVALTP
jgi:FKBP-type peptidyl-prolyl cis-trans isomerase